MIANANQYFIDSNRRIREAAMRVTVNAVQETEPYRTIDLSPWTSPAEHTSTDNSRVQVMHDIIRYSSETGSFNISGHGIPLEILERLESCCRSFFAMPLSAKLTFSKGDNRAGYVPVRDESSAAIYGNDGNNELESRDLREVYGTVYPPDNVLNVPAPADLQGAIIEYLHHMNRLDTLLHVVFTRCLAKVKNTQLPDDYLELAKAGSLGLLRCSHYPSLDPKYDEATKLKAHSDWGSLTILHSSRPGLEEIRSGRWHPVNVRPGELHVVVGEVMTMWSNGLFKNNIHRVSQRATGQDRISFAYFAPNIRGSEGGPGEEKKDEGCVGILPVCGTSESPLFERVTPHEHAENYMKLYFK